MPCQVNISWKQFQGTEFGEETTLYALPREVLLDAIKSNQRVVQGNFLACFGSEKVNFPVGQRSIRGPPHRPPFPHKKLGSPQTGSYLPILEHILVETYCQDSAELQCQVLAEF